jgi:hypothetical protein
MSFFKAVFKVGAVAGATEILLNPKTRTQAEQIYLTFRAKVVTPEMQKHIDQATESVRKFVK